MGEIILVIVMMTICYAGIGGFICAISDMDFNDPSNWWACILFWPIIVLISACRGLIKILKGEK